MKKYDDIVVGSGISGLTMALILGMNGRKVLLLEKEPRIGGSVARFYRKGVPFDIGFHFTGGLHEGGILHDILTALDLNEFIQPVFYSGGNASSYLFESENEKFELPNGIEPLKKKLKEYFKEETQAIDSYFERVENVCANTPSMDLRSLTDEQHFLDEDGISLKESLDGLTDNTILKTLLSGLAMCYGVRPSEISFAGHSRISQGLYQSIAGVKGGGAAFVRAFEAKFKGLDVDISCSNYIKALEDVSDKKVGRFILNSGEEVEAENCILTIHPGEILKIIPKEHVRKAFINRVTSFEPSTGFFSVFAVLDQDYEDPQFESSVVSVFPHSDLDQLLTPGYSGEPAQLIIRSVEQVRGRDCKTIVALEPSYPEDVSEWEDSSTGRRPQAYEDYKEDKADSIVRRIYKTFPEYEGRLTVLDTASRLTFRDYLHNFDGSAYGIKQKLSQFNLLGRLPLRNLFAAGQSSVLPGVIGAMLSSFIVGRYILDEEEYSEFLRRRLD